MKNVRICFFPLSVQVVVAMVVVVVTVVVVVVVVVERYYQNIIDVSYGIKIGMKILHYYCW